MIRPRTTDAERIREGERQELLRPCRQRDNERDGSDTPCSHAVRPDVRPQHHTRWRHFRLKHFCSLYLQSIESLDFTPKPLRAPENGSFVSY